jgi:hypothetical protein
MNALKSVAYAGVDAFTDMSGSDSKRREAYLEIISTIVAFLIALIIKMQVDLVKAKLSCSSGDSTDSVVF